MSVNRDREEEIFDAARELAAHERAAYLAEKCGQDADLRQRIEGMLEADAAAGEFFKTHDAPSPTAILTDASLSPSIEKPGDRIGRYKLLQQIGEGGMGLVYMAEQEEPVRRSVALKIIKLGMDTRQVVARFEAERQALAMMNHPHIAKVFDAGATDSGRPYFVMELVRGIPITEYCDKNLLPTRQRLDLFILVCQAVQHAHQKGVIHRDLKPSNILVTLNDGVPWPMIIDFGIAKATHQRLTEKTLFTHFAQMIGTPAYMSPEQAEMSKLDVDTRTDIYALGVLLYELLTGTTPFPTKELLSLGYREMQRTIAEREPPRLSTRLSTMANEERTVVAKNRSADVTALAKLFRGDLDWIAMKCLEKDRARRYETANGLASDIQRHLSSEPVMARPPTQLYRFQKLVRRNKLAFAAAGALAMMLLLGVIGSTWQAMRATRAEHEQSRLRQEAEAARTSESGAREQAEEAAKKSENVLDFMQGMFLRAAIRYSDRGTVYADQISVLQMLNSGAADATNKFRNQPDVAAAVQYSIGLCYSDVGEWDRARDHLQMALNLQNQLVGFVNPDTLATARQLASVALAQGKHEEAKALCHKILDAAKSGLADVQRRASDKVSFRTEELWACRKLTQVYIEEGKLSQAKPLISKLIAAAQAHELTDVEAGHAWSEAGTVALDEGHPQEALKAFDSELSFYSQGLVVQRAWCNGLRGAAYLALGEFEKAEPLLTNSVPILRRRFGDSHFRVRRAVRDLVSLYTNSGRLDQAEQWKMKLVEPDKTAAEKKRPVSPGSLELAATLAQTTQLLLEVQKYAEAEPLARECLAIHEKLLPDGWLIFNARSLLGGSLLGQKKYADAEPLLLSGYEGMKQREANIPTEGRPRLSEALQRLVQLYEETNRPDQATAAPLLTPKPLAPLDTPKPIVSTSAQLAPRLPSRDPRARPELLDLTASYNAALTDNWSDGNAGNNLTALPRGLQTFAGVEFDVRGLVQLRCSKPVTEPFPKEIKNIRVGGNCRKLHFLHAASHALGTTNGAIIGQFFIHQPNLPATEMPIRFGSDVRDWWAHPQQQPRGKDAATIAWASTNGLGQPLQLFKTTWENPRPDVKVESLDYASSMSTAAPFLIGITLE